MNGEVIVKNLLPHLQTWWPAIKMIGTVIGFVLIVIGIVSIISQGRQGLKAKGPILSIVSGILLLNLVSFLNVLAQSIFGAASETGLSYSAPGGSDPTAMYITFAVYVVMLVGLCGIIYGGILLKRASEDGRLVGAAITHFVGGTLAVNIVQLLHLLSASLGPSVDSAVRQLIG